MKPSLSSKGCGYANSAYERESRGGGGSGAISDSIVRIYTLWQLDGIPPGGAPVFTHSADVSTASGAQEAVDACVGNFGPLDVLICCQGSSNPLIFSEASVESLEEVRQGWDAPRF